MVHVVTGLVYRHPPRTNLNQYRLARPQMQGPPYLHDPPEDYAVPLPCIMCADQGFQVDCTGCNLKQQIANSSQTNFLTLPNQLSLDFTTFQQPAATLPYFDPFNLSSAPIPPDAAFPIQPPTHSQAFPMAPIAIPTNSTLQLRVPWSRDVLPVAEPRIQDVTVSLWTSVPIDTLMMSELLASYFQQGYLISIPFQKDLFLEDLVSDRNKPSEYETKHCSPLLVNAILATAANTYTSGPLIAKGYKLASLAESFLTQAMLLWESEVLSEPKLTTIQAAQILSLYHATMMQNDTASAILSRAVAMAAELELFTASDDDWTSTGMARKFTSWSLFSWQSTYYFYNSMPPLVTEPPITTLPDYASVGELTGEVFLGNPETELTKPLHLGITFRAVALLNVILNDINLTGSIRGAENTKASTLAKQQILTFCARLRFWFSALPKEIQNSQGEIIHHLRIHLAYAQIQYTLLEPWVQDGSPALTEDKDTRSLYEWGLKSQIKRQQLVELFHIKHGEIGAGNFRWLHPFLLGSLPGGRKTKPSTQPSEYA
ncbi:unnamed protein product [Clonostachys rosea]|uniref:Xylanolytic transcriptional activator regulatory domain-containing protein n=1 Tax=Bionectria ochroleuca TaxID=29856 RepID=A0ABY6UXD0_BIOOC|nr:unnamed protein product [Clonostachys rosea]